MTKRFHPLTTWKCEQITAETDGIGQGISHESMRAAYDYAVNDCSDWIDGRYNEYVADEMRDAVLAEPKGLKRQMLYALKNDEDNDRLLELINSMEDN